MMDQVAPSRSASTSTSPPWLVIPRPTRRSLYFCCSCCVMSLRLPH